MNHTDDPAPTGKRQRIEAQTATQRAHAEPPTELVGPVTLAPTELAWSRADDEPEPVVWDIDGETALADTVHDDGRRPLSTPLLAFLAVVVIAGAVLLLALAIRQQTAPRADLPTVAAPPISVSAPAIVQLPAGAAMNGRFRETDDFATATYVDSGPSDWGVPTAGVETSYFTATTACDASGCTLTTTPEVPGDGDGSHREPFVFRWAEGQWAAQTDKYATPDGGAAIGYLTIRPHGSGAFVTSSTTRALSGPHIGMSTSYEGHAVPEPAN